MRYRIDTDPFETKQPPMEFGEYLWGPMHEKKPPVWNMREAAENEVYISKAQIKADFPDGEGLLETAYEDFKEFLSVNECGDGDYCFETVLNVLMKEESYRITVSETECKIESADTEGIRRALFYIEDEMARREGLFLPKGEIYRYAVVKKRISRGFLNPHYCPGCDGELEDDTEYYPDGYLNRLAHDGVNGIWVQERIRVIATSEIIPEYGQNGEERVARLNRLIERCKRYGIKVYLESIEPSSTFQNPDLNNHPEVLGQPWGGEYYTFCASTDAGKAYIWESVRKLFELCPGLAGIVNISVGEAISNCASLDEDLTCPHCLEKGYTKGQVLANCENEIAKAMHSVKPEAELISWTYGIRGWKKSDIEEYLDVRQEDSVTMMNFEDWGEAVQLGKVRHARDYWLSYTGPGKIMEMAAEAGIRRNTPVYAKLQVCSSHEVSTVPYVPVPGILYDKYKYMHENNVTGALYCWYFGNFPSMMNKAAGELAFAPFFPAKDEFLKHIAGIYWGSNAEKVASAYNLFEEGYSNYPVSMTFEWHGPMGDGPVWPLHLEVVDLPISRSYKLMNMVGSDRLGETMLMGHTYDEALELCQRMSEKWAEGEKLLSALDDKNNPKSIEDKSVASALDVLFRSGTNIIKFYDLRHKLAFLDVDKTAVLNEMQKIAVEEIENSKKLIKLCDADKRLGYHCEAIGFKYFPEKLEWRIGLLEELLETEFPAVQKRIDEGKLPLPFCYGLGEDSHRYVTKSCDINDADWESFMFDDGGADNETRIRVSEDSDSFTVQLEADKGSTIKIKPEFRMFHPYVTSIIENGKFRFYDTSSYGLFEDRMDREMAKWNVDINTTDGKDIITIKLLKAELLGKQNLPFRLAVECKNGERISNWEKGDRYYGRLIFGNFSPDSYVFVIPKDFADLR